MLNNCLQWFKVSLRTLTTAESCLTHLFHDCTSEASMTTSEASVRHDPEACVHHTSLVTCG